eukprot:6734070-Prymnesium_polylepis.1
MASGRVTGFLWTVKTARGGVFSVFKARRVCNWCNLVLIKVQGEPPVQAAVSPIPPTRAVAAFLGLSDPGK